MEAKLEVWENSLSTDEKADLRIERDKNTASPLTEAN